MEAAIGHPVFLAVFAMAVAGGVILLALLKYGHKWFGNGGNGDMQHIQADLAEIKADLKGIKEFQMSCRLSLMETFITRMEFLEWKKGRDELKKEGDALWEALNRHYHDTAGGVVRGRKDK
jgi:hypothetical protein